MTSAITYDWGDGQTTPSTLGTTETHTYADDGVYPITVQTTDGSATGETTFVAGSDPDVTLVIADFAVVIDAPTEYPTQLNNTGENNHEHCSGQVRFVLAGLAAAQVTWEQQGLNGGTDWDVVPVSDVDGAVQADYGDFPVDSGLAGATQCRLTVASGAPVGVIAATSTIFDEQGSTLTTLDYTITVAAGA